MNKLILNENLFFNFNPFGGLSDDEIQKVLVPKSFTNDIINDINNDKINIIELVGAKGRGKTSLLRYLNNETRNASLISLDTKKDNLLVSKSIHDILFLDSIHNISFLDRLTLYKSRKKLILTTHISRVLEYKIANSSYKKYKVKGIRPDILKNILINRIAIATNIDSKEINLDTKYINYLVSKFKDDYRAILNFLYDNFKT